MKHRFRVVGLVALFGGLGFPIFTLAHPRVPDAVFFFPDPGALRCSAGSSWDSFGRGVESSFRPDNPNLRLGLLHDEACYLLGVKRARELLQEAGAREESSCRRAFDEGYPEGFQASPLGAGTPCYAAGYQSGLAALEVGAREGDAPRVGLNCVLAYGRGVQDAKGSLAAQPPLDQPLMSCYNVGYSDGVLFR